MKIADVWEKAKVAYQWLGGHPTVAGLLVGFVTGVTIAKALHA